MGQLHQRQYTLWPGSFHALYVLAALRLAEVVRYETDGTRARYRLKHPREIRQILRSLSEFIDSTSPSRR